MKILHILSDWIICDYVPRLMQKCPGEHYFVRFVPPSQVNKKFKYIGNDLNVRRVACPSDLYLALVEDMSFDYVWQHGIYGGQERFLLRNHHPRKVIWSTWGFDYSRYGVQWLFGVRTTLRLFRYLPARTIFKKFFVWLLQNTRLLFVLPFNLVKVLPKIDYYSVVVPSEEVFMRKLLSKRAKRIDFNYISDQPLVKKYTKVNLDSHHILLGNSADITNNHLDVLPMLKKCEGYHVLVPLSYDYNGEGKSVYQTDVIKHARKLLGENFTPLVDFLPYDEYVKLTQKCSVYIFGHRRQKALGNVDMALRRGALVFMNDVSPVFKFYRDNGMRLYSLSELKKRGIKDILNEFRPWQQYNIDKFNKLRSHDVLLSQVQATLRRLEDDLVASKSWHD